MPIKKDSHLFEERQKGIWDDVHARMERRRKEWEGEVERMRKDFFRLKPSETRRGSSENLLETMDLDHIFHDDVKGNKRFQVSFDVSQFSAEEIGVRTEETKLIVHAKHEETGEGKNVSREFSRTVDIPKHVDPEALTCTLSKDGILTIEAKVDAPHYDQIVDNAAHNEPLFQAPPPVARDFSGGAMLTEQEASRKMKFVVDIGPEFNPEDICVKTIDRKLQVTARHEEKSQGRTSMREFSKEFELPEDVDPNAVVASMTDDGKLILEAPISGYQQGSYVGRPGSTKKPQITISLR